MTTPTIRYPLVFGIRLTERDAQRLRDLAARDDRPPSTMARRLLVEALNQRDRGK